MKCNNHIAYGHIVISLQTFGPVQNVHRPLFLRCWSTPKSLLMLVLLTICHGLNMLMDVDIGLNVPQGIITYMDKNVFSSYEDDFGISKQYLLRKPINLFHSVLVSNYVSTEKGFLLNKEDCIKSHNHQFYIQPLSGKVLASTLC